MIKPYISVVMSVYNNQQFLPEAIDSILNQTYSEFEFIITDDGSTDNTPAAIDTYAKKDSRIIAIHQKNMGLTKSLNNMISIAGGDFIARMDADDISFLKRFEKQIKKLRENPDYLAAGCWFQAIDEHGVPDSEIFFPDNPTVLKESLHRGKNCYCHGSVMMRREVFDSLGLSYRFKYGQDMDLWLSLSEHGTLGMVEEVLYQRHHHAQTLSKSLIPRRAALMHLMLSLGKERQRYGREINDWEDEEKKILENIPLWTDREIAAHDKFLEARMLLCSGENEKARQILVSITDILGTTIPHYIAYLPGFLTAPILRLRDKINNKRDFVRPV